MNSKDRDDVRGLWACFLHMREEDLGKEIKSLSRQLNVAIAAARERSLSVSIDLIPKSGDEHSDLVGTPVCVIVRKELS